MKKILCVLALSLSLGVFAQDAKPNKEKKTKQEKLMSKDHITMKDGKVWVVRDGSPLAMEKDMTLVDGTMISTKGQVMLRDGKSKMMVDGDLVTLDGVWLKETDKVTKM